MLGPKIASLRSHHITLAAPIDDTLYDTTCRQRACVVNLLVGFTAASPSWHLLASAVSVSTGEDTEQGP